jgi:glycosyltransferase involved in cell wall biosynthesis
VAGTRVHVVPLPSDLDPALCPPFIGPEDRHDFVMIGRLNAYKNVDVVLEAWQRHVAGDGWRGEDLVFIGDGPAIAGALPKHTRWRPGRYRYCDVVATLAAAKGSVAHYRRASQSGVQVLSMQLGVTPIVSTAGGLPEFQPPGCPVGVDDVAGLATAFDELADPCTATLRGAAAARHYAQRFAVDYSADRLLKVLTEVLAARSPAAGTSRGRRDTETGWHRFDTQIGRCGDYRPGLQPPSPRQYDLGTGIRWVRASFDRFVAIRRFTALDVCGR